MTKTEQLFDEAITTIQSRGVVYGHPFYNMERISKLVSSYLEYPSCLMTFVSLTSCKRLVVCRKVQGHHDSLVDIAAYIGIYKTVYDAEIDSDFKKGDD
jgi:hypothetical protein